MELVVNSLKFIANSAADVLPIMVFLFAFQLLVLGSPIPHWRRIAVGFLFVVVGLGLFLVGLEQTLFPLGRLMAKQLTDPDFLQAITGRGIEALVWQDYYWVYLFALAIGFSTTLAEPALIAVSTKAHQGSGGAVGIRGWRWALAGPMSGIRATANTILRAGPGLRLPATACPTARKLTRSIKSLTTARATAACSKARRTARRAS